MTLPPAWTRSSGDMIADRRYAYARDALAENDLTAALDLFQQLVEIAPGWPPAQFGLGEAALACGETSVAREALTACLALDPPDRLGASALLAGIAGHAERSAMPDAYVAALFDDYAPRFDAHLVAALDYRAPALLIEALKRHRTPFAFGAACDLGCGTGLMGVALGDAPKRLVGVDLSGGMLARAEATGRYAGLARAGLLDHLAAATTASLDLVIAADVFCYVPELAPIFREVRRVLQPGGILAFTVQTHPGAGAIIGADRRVQHAMAHVRETLAEAGLVLCEERAASSRKDRDADVPGALYVATRA